MLWGASVPTSDRGLPKSNFRYLSALLPKSPAGAPAATLQKPPPKAQIEGTRHRGGRGCCGAAGVALGCFGSDQRPWLTEIQIFVLRLTKIVSGRARFNATETEFPAPKPPPASPNRGQLAKEGPWVPWGSWGCFGVLRFRPEPASGVWLPKSNFGYLPYDSGKAAARASTPQKPNFRLSNRPFGWPA